ncbi:hypothetical protein B0H10DRAFT_1965111 [Mycena sp. CBHHK59/15]|nr:hypothetical protein B0H10DRAFT_1965111 [Mycena sp. CBHHK59/15]
MSDSGLIPLDPTTATGIEDRLKILRSSLKVQVPYTSGVLPVKAEDLVVYYDTDDEKNARQIDFGSATVEDLVALTAACQQATFGVNQEDVLDESYRKAGKMDPTKFAARLDVVASGLIDAISPDILEGQNAEGEKVLKAEMYKLNVYGPGSFFKAHKDTPRGETMIGSLVVVFPTAHEGGTLTLEHGGSTWAFESATMLADPTPAALKVAYVAFYSDVTHAVEPVTAGSRVTLTYNLYLAEHPTHAASAHRIPPAPERTFEETLRALLADPVFLPAGGLLGYGLAHQYPIPSEPIFNPDGTMKSSRIGYVLKLLKGVDARVRTVSERVGLETHVKVLYDSGDYYEPGHDVLADDVLELEKVNEAYDDVRDHMEQLGVILKRGAGPARENPEERRRRAGNEEDERERTGQEVHWVTKISDLNRVGSEYLAYGNDASLKHMYGDAALFVRVPSFGEGIRSALQ